MCYCFLLIIETQLWIRSSETLYIFRLFRDIINDMPIKIRELSRAKCKIGYYNTNGVHLEPIEESTFKYLTLFGFNIETIVPTNIKKAHNPDILLSGTICEVKTPNTSNEATIKKRFHKASKQASAVVFDLRFIRKNTDKVEKQVIKLFKGNDGVRRLIIIEKTGKVLDMIK